MLIAGRIAEPAAMVAAAGALKGISTNAPARRKFPRSGGPG
jgi:hypothetical protein